MNQPKVLALPANSGAIGRLRIIQPFNALKKQELIHKDSEVYQIDMSKKDEIQNLGKKMMGFDVVWLHIRTSHYLLWEICSARAANPNLRIVIDIDDNIFDVNPWNPCCTSFAIDPILIGDTLVKPDMESNLNFRRIAEALFDEADALIVTTGILAELYSKYNKNIFVMPNYLPWEEWHYTHVGRRLSKDTIVGWQGGNTHLMDWAEVHPAIAGILQNRKDTTLELCTVQDIATPFTSRLNPARLKLYDFINYDAHPYRSNILRPDIGLCPLAEDPFSICKSDLKFTEYAALKVPVVASNVGPYAKSIIHGKTGFLASNSEEWFTYITLLIENHKVRDKIGQAAYDWAYQNRRLEGSVKEWADTINEVATLPSWCQPK